MTEKWDFEDSFPRLMEIFGGNGPSARFFEKSLLLRRIVITSYCYRSVRPVAFFWRRLLSVLSGRDFMLLKKSKEVNIEDERGNPPEVRGRPPSPAPAVGSSTPVPPRRISAWKFVPSATPSSPASRSWLTPAAGLTSSRSALAWISKSAPVLQKNTIGNQNVWIKYLSGHLLLPKREREFRGRQRRIQDHSG